MGVGVGEGAFSSGDGLDRLASFESASAFVAVFLCWVQEEEEVCVCFELEIDVHCEEKEKDHSRTAREE